MRIDLHAHSTASDGTDRPAELMLAAAAAGLDVVALTDHDTTGGWDEARAARPAGLTVIPGAEFSTQLPWQDWSASVHLLGYLFDPQDPAILDEHRRLRAERLQRGIRMVELMVAAGLPISVDQVLTIAGSAPVGRPHIGRALVDSGVVGTVTEAFAGPLSSRAGFYVSKADTPLPAAVAMIAAAGGVSVLAHPRGRGEARVLTPERIEALVEVGLTGLEVDHPNHGPQERAELRRLADRLGLLTTGSSDYHGHNKTLQLGQETTADETLRALIAASDGRTVPWD